MANQPNFIPSAFASSGDKNTIPASDGGTGAASFAAGFPPKTALPLNAGGVAPDRKDFNGIFNILSQFAAFQQSGGTFGYSNTQDYTKGAVVTDGSTGALYVCILANGPGTSAGVKALTNASYWRRLMDASTVMTGATSSTAGAAGVVPAPAAGQQGKTLLGSGTWGQDPDIIAAKAAGQIGGAAYVASDNDLDNYLTAGIFYFSVLLGGLVNGPAGCTYGYLTVSAVNDNSPTSQRFVQSASQMYVRTKPSGDGAWTSWVREAVDTDVMTGATSSTPGKAGLVPAPAAGQQGKTLLGSGTWGQDADVTAAKTAGQIGGAALRGDELDLNRFNAAGFYYLLYDKDNYVNCPDGFTGGFLQVLKGASPTAPVIQICYSQTAKTIYTRRGSGAAGGETWGEWIKTADSDMLAYAASHGQIGNITQQAGAAVNLNDYKETGNYFFSAAQSAAGNNFPATNLVTWLAVLSTGGSPTKQIALIAGTNAMYQRYYAGSTWGPWVRIDVDIMTGATSSTAGAAGLVPAPAAGAQGKTLLGSGTWGQDPDIVAAKNAGLIGNAVYVTSDFDLNNYTTQGNYYFSTGNTIVNGPPGAKSGFLSVSVVNTASPTVQTFVRITNLGPISYVRSRGTGSSPWNSWIKQTYEIDAMTGATSSSDGTKGLVPAPSAGEQAKYLLGNGTWGKDADVVAAIAANQIGNVAYVDSTVTAPDLDNYTTSGAYLFSSAQVSGGSHFPLSSGVMWLWVTAYASASPTRQIASGVASKVYYERHRAGATWTSWAIISCPFPQAAAGAGQWTAITGGSDGIAGDCKLPANGTWAYFAVRYRMLGNHEIADATSAAGVDAGGTIIFAAATSTYSVGFAWRVS